MTHTLKSFGYGVMLAGIFAIVVSSGAMARAQQNPDPGQLLSPDQLDYLVAPIALYPDPLISQILVATTYPLEIVEASQWLQRNPNIRGAALTQAASNQDWDPSVQALVVFPDVMKYLTEDISWTTNLGNAFLAQEGDVMDAIQRMRDKAAQSGKLKSTPEQQVIRVVDAGQPVYEIVPTNPTVIYVPVYDPYWIWGSAVYYPYPRWYYPPHASYLYFNSGIYIDAYFGSGWYGSATYGPGYRVWNSWGWRPAWNTRTVVVNNVFIDNHHFNSNRPRNGNATAAWSHDAAHRRGVVYPASASYDRYRRDPRDVPRPQQGQGRSVPAQALTRNAGPTSPARPVERSNERSDRRPDVRQDGRQDVRSGVRQDSRIATAGATPNVSNRDNRSSSDFRNNPADLNPGSARIVTNPGQAYAKFTRPLTPAPGLSTTQGGSRNQAPSRDSQIGRNSGTTLTRTQSPTPSRETGTGRAGQQAASPARQAGPVRNASPGGFSPSQQTRMASLGPSSAQASPPRQSASSGGSGSVGRSAPAQQSAPSSNAQGSGRSSNSGSNGGGNSRGRR